MEQQSRPSVKLEHDAEDAVLLGSGLGHNPLGYLQLHRHNGSAHAQVVVTQREQNLAPPPSTDDIITTNDFFFGVGLYYLSVSCVPLRDF